MQISGCSAIVTGGTGGMGEATVRRLHAAGARVVVADVADEKGKALEQELGGIVSVHLRHADTHAQRGVLRQVCAMFLAKAFSQSFEHRVGICNRCLRQQQAKFLAAQPSNAVARA